MAVYGLLIRAVGVPGRFFALHDTPVRVGRGNDQDIILAGGSVSKAHLEVTPGPDGFVLTDVGSKNGTFVNKQKITTHPLAEGDIVTIGDFTLEFAEAPAGTETGGDTTLADGRTEIFLPGEALVDMTSDFGLPELETQVITEPEDGPDAIQKAYQRLSVMYEVTQAVAGYVELPMLLKRISEVVVDVLDTERCVILLRNETTGESTPVVTSWGENVDPTDSPVLLSRTMVDEVLRTGRCIVTRDAQADDRLKASQSVLSGGIHSALCVPLRNKESIIGLIYCDNRVTKLALVRDDLLLLAGISGQAQLAIENARLFEQLKRRQEQLIRSEKVAALGRLAGGIAHQIRNPLSAIIGFSELYAEKLQTGGIQALDPEELAQYLTSMVTQGKRCDAIAENLLMFSRPSPSEPRPVHIEDVLEEVLAILEYELTKSQITCVKDLDPSIPATVADPAQLRQVFMNLMINAKEAMPGGGTLTLSTHLENKNVVAGISDSGRGITQDLLARIFEPLFTTKPDGEGTGLGLYVARHVLTEHGGKLEVSSRLGEGTTFSVTLPAGQH